MNCLSLFEIPCSQIPFSSVTTRIHTDKPYRLKCNRSNPCENCVRRGDANSCTYAQAGTRKKIQTSQGPTSPDDMQNRIDRLEGLVLALMTNGAQSAGPAAAVAAISRSTSDSVGSGPANIGIEHDDEMVKEEGDGDSDIEAVSNSFGVLKVDNEKHKTMYFGDSHWHMVLADASLSDFDFYDYDANIVLDCRSKELLQ